MKTLLVVLLGLLFVVASAHEHGKNKHDHKKEHASHNSCSYTSTRGHSYDLSRLSRTDLIVMDHVSGSTFHYSPCGSVHEAKCPAGSAVCELTNKGEAISHGQASTAKWADGVESRASLELTYGNGEMCSEGTHRKSVVELRCTASADPNTTPSSLVGVIKEDCLLKLVVDSPIACDRESMCAAITSEVTCQLNQDLCEWNDGQCVPTTGNKDFDMRRHVGVIVVSAALSFTAVVFLCCALACACLACRRIAQRRRTIKRLPTRRPKKNGFVPVPQHDEFELHTPETTAVNIVPAVPAPEAQHPYPFQPYVMMQAADGTLVPVAVPFPPHSYSHPMVQVIPGYHVQQPATQ